MIEVTTTAVIAAPPEDVFPAVADPERQVEWDDTLRSVEKLTDGPLAEGSRYRGTFKGLGTVEYEFVEHQPPRRFTHSTRLPLGEARHTFVLEPADGGTQVRQTLAVAPSGLGKLARPLVPVMLRRRARAINARLGSYFEQRGPVDGP